MLTVAMVCPGPGCGLISSGLPGRTSTSGPGLTPAEPRVDAVLGSRLVMPVTIRGSIDDQARVRARLDDGRVVSTELYWLGVSATDRWSPWVEPAGQWSATPASAGTRPQGAGYWALVCDLPADAIDQGLWLGDRHVPIRWLPDPYLVGHSEAPPTSPVGDDVRRSTYLDWLLEPEQASPVRRWRYRLLRDGLAPRAGLEHPTLVLPDHPTMPDPVLEAFAVQNEARWRIALSLLARADAGLAAQVERRLCAVGDFDGLLAPVWPSDGGDLDRLLQDLLDPTADATQRSRRARLWLDQQPAAISWVIDDVGGRDWSTGDGLATIGVMNLGDRPALAWTEVDGAAPDEELATAAPLRRLTLATRLGQNSSAPGTARPESGQAVRVLVGAWSITHRLRTGPTPADPPGVRLTGFSFDWTLHTWRSGQPDPAMVAGQPLTSALLQRTGRPGEPGAWTLFVQCRRSGPPAGVDGPAAAGEPATAPLADQPDSVRVWLGPTGIPTAVVRVFETGVLLREGARPDESGLVPVARDESGWTARVPVPDECVEASGLLRLGVERLEPGRRRSAWPRPMLPWQAEPGRLSIDTSAWSHLGD